jgi:two-component system invasion response regulator UvrY
MTRSEAALRLMLVDDHPIVRRGVRDILADAFPSSTIEEVGSGGEALAKMRSQRWDLVILDLTLPDGSGLDVLARARDVQAHPPVLILSMHAAEQFARRAIGSGAAGYLTKVTAVTKIIRGATHFAPDALEELALDDPARADPHQRLSDREQEVFLMIARGKTVSAIAAELGLSIKTVSTYRHRVLIKMNMASNAELYRYAIHYSLVN